MERLILVFLGGALGVDETSVGQTMVSRPIVAGSLAGWAAGSISHGFLLGAFLECIYASQLKVGGSKVPDGTSAAVVGAAVAALDPTPGGVALGLVAALFVGDLGGRVTVAFRRWCGRLVPLRPGVAIPPGHLGRLHATLVAADFFRGAAVTAAGVLTLPIWLALAGSWPLGPEATLGLIGIAAATTLGVLWGSFSTGRVRLALMGVGLLMSLAIGVG